MRLSGRKTSFARPWTQRQRMVLLTLLGVNVAAFGAQLLLESFQAGFVHDYLGLSETGVQNAYAWQFVTAAFMNGGPWHLVWNVLALYLLGRVVESILGPRHFLLLYL
ncbi:MAG: rhomboid family intramembrane serine protease, partial [Chthoniobacterales bacterium]|nr:rhomboid family intramembrane serine protease [Chthoniobacterales bacterium]